MRTVPRLLLAIVVLTVLAWATPALAAQIVPGSYTLTWMTQGTTGQPPAPFVIDGSTSVFVVSLAGIDASSPFWGLCTTPYAMGNAPTSPEFGGVGFWCLNADGTLGDRNVWLADGQWAQYSPTVALINVNQAFRGSTAIDTLTAIARLIPPPPLPPPATLKVFITQPKAPATVRGTVWVVLWVEGTSGASNVFTLSADGKQVATQTTTARGPVSIPWPTTALPNGTHTLTGTVRDATGNTGTTSITVILNN